MSFFGGGTDYPQWYLEEGGATLSTTIDKYCHISCRYLPPFFIDYKHRIVWSHIETVSSIAEILHPAIRAGLHYMGFDDTAGVELHHQGDLPARSGIGSSSAFTVGLINALTALRGERIGKHELAVKAIELEQEVLKEHVGSQDQVAAAYGGFNIIHFGANNTIKVEPLGVPVCRISELQSSLMLFYTGTTRIASLVAKQVIDNIPNNGAHLRELRSMVDHSVSILRDGSNLDQFGKLLHQSWMLKRELGSEVSNPAIDIIYQAALDHGASGGKLLGAGSKGFMVFYVPPDKQVAVREALSTCLQVPFRFENQGSTIIYTDSDNERIFRD